MKPSPSHGADGEMIERMERGGDAASEEETAARAPYRRLIERIHDLDVVEPPPGWVDRAVERWERASAPPPVKPARRWAAWAGLAAALTAALIVLVPRCRDGGAPADRFVASVQRTGQPRADGFAIGDTLTVHAPRHGDDAVELRVYRDDVLIARCPGDRGCRSTARAIELELSFAQAGVYQAIAITGPAPLPAPSGGLDADLHAARRAELKPTLSDPFDVR